MKKIYEATTIRQADAKAFSNLKISGTTLMENAGKNLTSLVIRKFPGAKRPLILVGPGNNGGDGLVMARHFLIKNIQPIVLLSRTPSLYCGETLENLKILQELSDEIYPSEKLRDQELSQLFIKCDLVIDSLLGTGSKGTLRGEVLRLVRLIRNDIPVIAVDIPTGVNPDTGRISDDSVHATMTGTLLASKPGLHALPGSQCAGDVHVCDIGIPDKMVLPSETSTCLLQTGDLRLFLPQRGETVHKGKRGNLLVLGGSAHFRGAIGLTCLGALRAGAGVVVAAVPECIASDIVSLVPEAVVLPIPSKDGHLPEDSLDICLQSWDSTRFQSMVFGPGLGRTEESRELTRDIWNRWTSPCVIDADALHALSVSGTDLPRRNNVILTPHEGEAAHLLETTPDQVSSNRLNQARKLALRWGNLLLKGPGTIIDDGTKRFILDPGHPCLSVPGSGDVMSGAIGAFLAAGMKTAEAGIAGSLLHALAGNELGKVKGIDGTLAQEIATEFPTVLEKARQIDAFDKVNRRV